MKEALPSCSWRQGFLKGEKDTTEQEQKEE